ncbi:probable glucosamine 6-phosphate N-acetyltransferase isoform X2 [Dermacentor silvarum]|uniref:probable glucosamine 6-phosphate N-acetyltransferase isoform X2 n=1 Tax=Dermacentor silvarum TaxID=543639 RepID=UPI00189C51A5|nr:probable glucosamine 6-phosphate N-acetyltransferase isoform X2 [Dermacentor silvarum]
MRLCCGSCLLRTNGGEPEDTLLFDPKLLESLDAVEGISVELPPTEPPLKVRPLSSGDYDRGFLDLLTQLTVGGDVSRQQFLDRFRAMKAAPDTYYVTVIEDTDRGVVIASATLFAELKFIRGLATRGHIEDVVVSSEYRGRNLGKLLIQTLVRLGKRLGCYRLTLDCKDTVVKFYANNGFALETGSANSMSLRFVAQSQQPSDATTQ